MLWIFRSSINYMFRLYVEVFVVLRRILPEFETFFTRCSLGFINDNNIAIQPHRNLSIFLVIYIWKGHGQYIQAKISVFYFRNILKICVLKLPRLLKLITCDSIAFFFWSICLAISITRVQTQGPGQSLTSYDKVSCAMVILLNTRRTRGRCELNSVTLWGSKWDPAAYLPMSTFSCCRVLVWPKLKVWEDATGSHCHPLSSLGCGSTGCIHNRSWQSAWG